MDDVLAEALAPVLRDVERAGLLPPVVDDADWIGDPDYVSAMMWDRSGSGAGISVPRNADLVTRVVVVADQVQEWVIESQLWGAAPTNWPPCPTHPDSHPLQALLVHDGTAAWTCPRDGATVAPVGDV